MDALVTALLVQPLSLVCGSRRLTGLGLLFRVPLTIVDFKNGEADSFWPRYNTYVNCQAYAY